MNAQDRKPLKDGQGHIRKMATNKFLVRVRKGSRTLMVIEKSRLMARIAKKILLGQPWRPKDA